MQEVLTEVRRLGRLALPVVITQLSAMLMGVVDTMMVGHVGVDTLGAAALGHIWVFGTLVLGVGLVMGIDPIATQAHGSRNRRALALSLQQGFLVAGLASIPIAVAWIDTSPILQAFGQDAHLSEMARNYVLVQIPSIPAFLGYFVLRQHLQGRAIMQPAMWVAILANVVNVVFNWALIFGHLGFPAMGLVGAGIATSVVRIFMFLGLLAFYLRFRLHRGAWVPWSRESFHFSGVKAILSHGIPVGVQFSLEIWAFQIATLMSGTLGTEALDANVIVLNLASITFMVPWGISQAAATRVGNLIGQRNPLRARLTAWIALGMGASVMAVSALIFITFREHLPRIYTQDPVVRGLAASIVPMAAAFQVFDGTQVVGTGVLRGMGRTRPAAAFNLVGYYLLALPLAWWLTFPMGMGLPGIWWGLVLGLASVAVMVTYWIRTRGPSAVTASVIRASG